MMTDAALGHSHGVDVLLSTIVYGQGGGRPLTLHLLRASPPPAQPAPVLVWVYGGAWRSGNKDSGLVRLLPFARHGYVCASIEYRLSPEARFPAQIEDAKCAIRFLRHHAATLGIDPERIGVWGPSAGGHLAALLGTAPDVPELEGRGGWMGTSSRVQAVCDCFGPSDLQKIAGPPSQIDHAAPDAPEALLLGGPIGDLPELAAAASPVHYVTGAAPPFLIMHGDADQTVPWDQSRLLYEALLTAGTEVTFHTLLGAGHGGPAFEQRSTQQVVMDFFDRHLRPAALAGDSADDGNRHEAAPPMVTLATKLWVAPATAPPGTTYRTFASRAAGEPIGYALYLPPGYDDEPARRYPVVYWLHGRGGDPSRGAAFVQYLQQAIDQRIVPPLIAVLVNGLRNGFYCNSADGKWPVERVVIDDLIPHVDATYRTVPTREGRAIEGQSMGGFGAARLGFGYPDLFGAVSIAAGGLLDLTLAQSDPGRRAGIYRSIWGGDPAYLEQCNPSAIVRRNAAAIHDRTLVRIFVGDQDGLLATNRRYHQLLDELGLAHEYIVVPGADHSYDAKIASMGAGAFSFFAKAFARAGVTV
jgi:acetyl esterase/lipase